MTKGFEKKLKTTRERINKMNKADHESGFAIPGQEFIFCQGKNSRRTVMERMIDLLRTAHVALEAGLKMGSEGEDTSYDAFVYLEQALELSK